MHQILEHVDPYRKDSTSGFDLVVDGQVQAVVKKYGDNTDLVFQIRGPVDVVKGREIVVGLLDLLVHFDKLASKR